MQLNFPSNYIWTRRKIIFDLSRRELIRKSFSKSVECADQSCGCREERITGAEQFRDQEPPMGAGTCQQCQHAAGHTGSGHSDMPHILSHGNIYIYMAYTFKDKSPIRISQTNNTQWYRNILHQNLAYLDRSGWSCVHCVHLHAGSPGSVAAWLFPLKINVCIGLTFPR